MQGLFRYTKQGADWARVEVRRGEWTDLLKSDYEAQNVEPHFWGLPEEQSWRRDVLSRTAVGGD